MKIRGLLFEYFLAGCKTWQEKLAYFKLRLSKGKEVIGMFNEFLTIFSIGGIVVAGWPLWIVLVGGTGYYFTCYTLGYLAQKTHYWEVEGEIGTREVNNYFKKLEDDILHIKNGTK